MSTETLRDRAQAAAGRTDTAAYTGTVATRGPARVDAARKLVNSMSGEFARVLGDPHTGERFVRVALTALGRNPKLAECTPATLLGGLLSCAALRLEPNDPRGLAYLIPFENRRNGTVEAQLVIGYRGLVDLAYRSAQIKVIAAESVHANDVFRERRWPRELLHEAAQGDRGPVTCYYAAVAYKDGGADFAVMSVTEVETHRDLYSKGAQKPDSPWRNNFDAMAKKTVLRRLAKMMPLSVEDLRSFSAAVAVDERSVDAARSDVSLDLLLATPPIDAIEPAPDEPDVDTATGELPEHHDAEATP